MSSQVISLADGRQLGYFTLGKGNPVVYFHGTASSRLEILLLKELAQTGNLQIIGFDRAGYGLSTFQRRKSLRDFCGDVNALADYLGLERLGVLGWSGGGVFALAYLSLFPERVTRAVVAGTPALPFDVATAHNTPLANLAMKVPFIGRLAMKRMRQQVLKANGDIEAFLKSRQGKHLLHACSRDDLKFFSNPDWMRLLYQSMAEGFRQGNMGVNAVFQEHQIFMKPWDIPLANVPADKLFIWHGAEDRTCRVSNAQTISKRVPNAQLEVFRGKGHCVMFDYLGRLGETLGSG